ncbi:hypothetical protein GCM10010124_25200 [Pilimelia terevasa]|uniref:Uncharacterized protein n=1 Tax=Pilimelia terevasa TaxID=53372 RepID=A0A8J3BS55_9ACTN|nr:hypothetical protein [Pilimelia terevasa]GGK31410.1 hypothetical protein GCM10010124_25200 [Pilimelia terevasa]
MSAQTPPHTPQPPRPLRIGEEGIFAGDWALTYDPATGRHRVPVGFPGLLIDWWNGFAVWSCSRPVAEAVVADQQCLRDQVTHTLTGQGLTGTALRAELDLQAAPMVWDGADIIVDQTRLHGPADGLSRISPDQRGRYVICGWRWTWTLVDPTDCDRVADDAGGLR